MLGIGHGCHNALPEMPPKRVLPIFELSPHSGFNHPSTRAHVRLLGPCFKTGRIAPERHTILDRQPPRRWGQPWGLGTDRSIGTPSRPEPDDGPFSHDPCRWCGSGSIKSKPNGYQYNSLASNDFTYCFTFFSKSFSSFPLILNGFIWPRTSSCFIFRRL